MRVNTEGRDGVFEGGVEGGAVAGFDVDCGEIVDEGEEVVLLDRDLLDAPAEVEVVLEEFAGFNQIRGCMQ